MNRQLISYPKSGRSWIRYILSLMHVEQLVNFHHDTFEFNDSTRPEPNFDFSARIRQYKNGGRIVYLSRDPRDILVSHYFQITGRFREFFDYRGSLSEFIRDDYFGAVNLKLFRDQWRRLCQEDHVIEVTYESCHADILGVMQRILTHYAIPYEDSALRAAVGAASFERMREVERTNTYHQPWLRLRNGAPKVRRGKMGGYLDYLPADDIAYLDALFDIR